LIKILYSKAVDRRIYREKLDKRGVNQLLKKLRDIGTVDRRTGSGRPRSEKKIAMPSYA